jgi:PD-(D/E)XK nuclease superfamily protein
LVVYKQGAFYRVQVKYRSLEPDVSLHIAFKTIWNDKHGTHVRPVDKDEVDLFCVYCPDTKECYYFDPSECRNSITLRVGAPKNNQRKAIRLACDYRKVP